MSIVVWKVRLAAPFHDHFLKDTFLNVRQSTIAKGFYSDHQDWLSRIFFLLLLVIYISRQGHWKVTKTPPPHQSVAAV